VHFEANTVFNAVNSAESVVPPPLEPELLDPQETRLATVMAAKIFLDAVIKFM
jgi:hypothetical protein